MILKYLVTLVTAGRDRYLGQHGRTLTNPGVPISVSGLRILLRTKNKESTFWWQTVLRSCGMWISYTVILSAIIIFIHHKNASKMRQQVLSKLWYLCSRLHGITCQNNLSIHRSGDLVSPIRIKLQNLQFPYHKIQMSGHNTVVRKSKKLRLAENVASTWVQRFGRKPWREYMTWENNRRMILKWILDKQGLRMWTGVFWLRITTSGGLFWSL
jgi:hypothetical protein